MSSLLPSRRHLTNFLSRIQDIYRYSSHYRDNPVYPEFFVDNIERLIEDSHPNRVNYEFKEPIYLNSLLIWEIQNQLFSIYVQHQNEHQYTDSNSIEKLKLFINDYSYITNSSINSENTREFMNFFMFMDNIRKRNHLNINLVTILVQLNDLNLNNISFFVRVEEDIYFRINENLLKKTINYFVNIFSEEFNQCLGKSNIRFFSTQTGFYQSECNISCVYAIKKAMLNSQYINVGSNNKDDIIKTQIEQKLNELVLITEENYDIPLYHQEFNEELHNKIMRYLKLLRLKPLPPPIQQGGSLNKKLKIKKLKKYK